MGKLQVDWNNLSPKALASINTAVHKNLPNLRSGHELSLLLTGLSDLGMRWGNVSNELRLAFYAEMRRLFHTNVPVESRSSQQISTVLYGMGKCEVNWNALSPPLRNALRDRSIKCGALRNQDMAMTIYGLGKMNAKWNDLTPKFNNHILKSLAARNVFNENNVQSVTNTIWGLGAMQVEGSQLPSENIEMTVVKLAKQFTPQALTNTLLGLANVQVRWDVLSMEMQRALVRSIQTAQDQMSELVSL